MRHLAIILWFFSYQYIFGQATAKQVLSAENSFAEMAKKVGVKPAFLAYLAPGSVVFSEGKIKDAIEFYNQIEFKDKLEWQPYFVNVSAAQDIAYTVGTFQYYLENEAKEPVAKGFFSSIWKKQADDSWKVALDIGQISDNQALLALKTKANISPKLIENKQSIIADTSGLKAAIFSADYFLSNKLKKGNQKHKAYAKKIEKFSNIQPKTIFIPQGAEVAKSGDLAYVYGNVNQGNKQGNYLRIWQKESGKKWKVVVEIISD